MHTPKLSVVILTYNSEKDIDACLQSIYKCNDLGDDLEVILVDNNSIEQSKLQNHIKKSYSRVVYIQNSTNNGYGSGNNRGINASKAPYILIMNPDVQLRNFSFGRIVANFDKHSNCGQQGFKQFESTSQRGSSFVMLKPSLFSFFSQKIYHKLDLYNSRLFCFHGSCFALRKACFEPVAYFNEDVFLYGEERYLHYHLLKTKYYKAFYDNTQSYIHPIHGRALVLNQAELGLNSYLKTIDYFGLNRKKLIKAQIRFEYFFYWKSLLFGRTDKAKFYLTKIERLKELLP